MSRKSKARKHKERQKKLADSNVTPINRYKVQFMQEPHVGEYPEMYMTVYVAGDDSERRKFAELFVKSRCRKADTPQDADLVVFTGGPDVDPLMYGEVKHPSTRCDLIRDKADTELYGLCLEEGIPMLGICRGAQFLHVMNGGKLYQEVDNHYKEHTMWDMKNKRVVKPISSVHHQMCVDNRDGGMEIIAHTGGLSKERWRNNVDKETNGNLDIEAFFYRATCCIGIQGHPEYRGYPEFALWSMKLLEDLVLGNPDLELVHTKGVGSVYRMKKIFLDERQLIKAQGLN